jgi:hypothetical protein
MTSDRTITPAKSGRAADPARTQFGDHSRLALNCMKIP